ncbi:hypothetical protein NIIDNTM18_27340 [Mycolicibacterium litorale]|uniref:DoxX-like protein n=1 Tax=Mycolicibacterium litorale TaxID=758802 RepID=A0A6S6P5Y6_9MYCO|nr:DoxX family protein [Mycolicibacterium litorale]BCI53456.1 hypothetical protein NIIDNTM18_27340 [Mycolicibacterium litorale]
MDIAIIVVTIALAVYLGIAAVLNIFYMEHARENATHLKISSKRVRFIGWCQLAAVIGLVAGLRWSALAIAAAIGLLLLMIGAVMAHRKVGDPIKEMVPAAVVFLLTGFVMFGHIAQAGA